MSKAVSELNALCDVLSCMRTSTALDSAKKMYKRFCKPGEGTICIRYFTTHRGKICSVHFKYLTWLGMSSSLSIDTIKYY